MVNRDAAFSHHHFEIAVTDCVPTVPAPAHSTISPPKWQPLKSFMRQPLIRRVGAITIAAALGMLALIPADAAAQEVAVMRYTTKPLPG